jgi:hypothetical protein
MQAAVTKAQAQPPAAPAAAVDAAVSSNSDDGPLAAVRRLLQVGAGACPFPAGPLPLTPADIGSDGAMFSAYLHEAIPNCVLWGLFRSGALKTAVRDGAIPQLRLITDLFGGLIPELPKHYSKRGMLLEILVTEAPTVSRARVVLKPRAAGAQLGGSSAPPRAHD